MAGNEAVRNWSHALSLLTFVCCPSTSASVLKLSDISWRTPANMSATRFADGALMTLDRDCHFCEQ